MYKTAREKAGLSREDAAGLLHIGNRTLFDYEIYKTCTPADIALKMGDIYNDTTIPARHCKKHCPIGQVYAHEVIDLDMSTSILNIMNEFNNIKPQLNRLIAIGADGVIDEGELPDFEGILENLFRLEKAIETIKLRAASVVSIKNLINPKEKAPALAAAR